MKKVLVGLVNSAQDPLSWTQTQLKPSFSSIQTHAKSQWRSQDLTLGGAKFITNIHVSPQTNTYCVCSIQHMHHIYKILTKLDN